MAHLSLGDSRFYYELHGNGELLVLIAGYSCDHTFWEGMLSELTSHFQVLIFDNRGIGQTQSPNGDISIEQMADDTIAILAALKLKNPIILGQSMGGAIAQAVARKMGNQISKLIILNSVSKFSIVAQLVIENAIKMQIEKVSIDLVIDVCSPWFYSSNFLADKQNMETLKAAIKQNPFPQSVADQTRHYHAICEFDSRPWVTKISVPTLVLIAKEDIICTPTQSLTLAKQIKGAQVIALPGGHSTPAEAPMAANKAILSFLKNATMNSHQKLSSL